MTTTCQVNCVLYCAQLGYIVVHARDYKDLKNAASSYIFEIFYQHYYLLPPAISTYNEVTTIE